MGVAENDVFSCVAELIDITSGNDEVDTNTCDVDTIGFTETVNHTNIHDYVQDTLCTLNWKLAQHNIYAHMLSMQTLLVQPH